MADKTIASVVGLASYLPDHVMTNADLEKMVETSDEWIVSRTGIKERRIAGADETTATMGARAAEKLLAQLGRSVDEIDLILVATMTPDYLAPSTAALIQSSLGAKRAAAMDVQAACSGFLYGLQTAKAFIESGIYKNILFISSEKMSAFIDYTDRNTCVLFGDGASAAWISGEKKGLKIESVSLGADGDYPTLAWVPAGGAKRPPTLETVQDRAHFFKMEGKELFKHAVRRMASAAEECLKANDTSLSQIRWIVPHQANARILDAVAKAFELDPSAVYRTVHKYGNTSASSIPIALGELIEENDLPAGEPILLVAFGAGLTWGAALLRKYP
jgi:3-oxoacyl-[acyl-carrier-protein] synthase-3